MSTSRPLDLEQADAESRAKFIWTSVIILLLGLQLVFSFTAFFLATSDPTVAVVPNYHEKALTWDAQRQNQIIWKSLGWVATWEISADANLYGQREVSFSLKNAEGAPISPNMIDFRCYHHARANEVIKVTLHEDTSLPGSFSALVPMRKEGLWELMIKVEADGHSPEFQTTAELVPGQVTRLSSKEADGH